MRVTVLMIFSTFFFQPEDGIRDADVTGVQTCALPILGDYSSWPEQQRQEFLLRELQGRRPLVPRNWEPSEPVREVLATCEVVAQQTPEALGSYVISMASTPSDVLSVILLLREAGMKFPMGVVRSEERRAGR